MPPKSTLFWRVATVLVLAGSVSVSCSTTASDKVSADPQLAATAQLDQYRRDAEATETQRSIAIEANIRSIAATADAATVQAISVSATAQAIATQGEAERVAHLTAIAQSARKTDQAISASETAQALTLANAQAQATATAQAIVIRVDEDNAERGRVVTVALWIAAFIALALLIGLAAWLGIIAIRAYRNKAGLLSHGLFGHPLLVLEAAGGRRIIVDPTRLFGPGIVVEDDGQMHAPDLAPTPLLQERTTARAQSIALQQAIHSPHPPTASAHFPRGRRQYLGPTERQPCATPADCV